MHQQQYLHNINTVLILVRKAFRLHWLFIKYMTQYSRTEYIINIRRILVDTRCSNEFNGCDLIWFYGARMHDKICATNVLNIIVEKYMQILLMMCQNMAFFLAPDMTSYFVFHILFVNYELYRQTSLSIFYLLPTRNYAKFWGPFSGHSVDFYVQISEK